MEPTQAPYHTGPSTAPTAQDAADAMTLLRTHAAQLAALATRDPSLLGDYIVQYRLEVGRPQDSFTIDDYRAIAARLGVS